MHLDRQTCLLGLVLLTSLLSSSDATPGKTAPRAKAANSKSKPYDLNLRPAPLAFRHLHVNPLDTELVDESFDTLLQLTRTQDHDFDPEYIRSTLANIKSRTAQVSPLPMALILHGTLTYDNPVKAYEKAKDVASIFDTALDLVHTRLSLIESRGLGDMPSLLREERKKISRISQCEEAEDLPICLRILSKDYDSKARHFSHPTSPELYDPVLKAHKMRSEISLRACPAWITLTPPWALAPSAIHVLSLSQKPDIHLPKMLIEWIMCISIRFSNLSRKHGLIPTYSVPMRKAVYLLEDMMEDTLRNDAYNSENSISTGLYIKFKEILEKDESIRQPHLDYKNNGELAPAIDKMTPSAYSYNLLRALMPSQLRPSPASSPMSKYFREQVNDLERKRVLGGLDWKNPKGEILKEVMTTWIRSYTNGYVTEGNLLPLRKNHRTCKDLLGDLIPIAVREMTKKKPLQEKVEEEVRNLLSNRPVSNNRRAARVFEKGKADLSKVSQSTYKGFMIASKFKPFPQMGLRLCIRDFLYAIHRSYDEHRDMIDVIE